MTSNCLVLSSLKHLTPQKVNFDRENVKAAPDTAQPSPFERCTTHERRNKCRQDVADVIVLYQERAGAHQTVGNYYRSFVVVDSQNASIQSETTLLQLYSSFCKKNDQSEQFKVHRQKLRVFGFFLTRVH